ncbi:uncharacterized protein LOC124166074 [Ischnura elegans]|uniref:uncharacterized protein LOC124154412 n=1 Tax=Ischnura elegans TaxID=197161 RepID=UPI001ED8B43E|nr:uncharacterized protein LOC124154412 [Ischnura elegans]XP_046399647.1 uncharacterized protein LOC124166074 [Ischnura elegans]
MVKGVITMSPKATPMKLIAKAERRNARASGDQLNYLVDYMLAHKEFAAGRLNGGQGKAHQKNQWERLADTLNDFPGADKAVSEWKKCWADLRCHVRARVAKINKAATMTGNTLVPPELGDLDRKVVCVIGECSSIGIADIPDLGLTVCTEGNEYEEVINCEITEAPCHLEEEFQEETIVNSPPQPPPSPPNSRPSTSARTPLTGKRNLMEKMCAATDDLQKMQRKTNELLQDLNSNVNNISETLQSIAQSLAIIAANLVKPPSF